MTFLDTLGKGVATLGGVLPDPLNPKNKDGFILPDRNTADGNGLPFQKVNNNNVARKKRHIISWLIPEFGIVKMYINPQRLVISDRKLINKDKTKGGYTLQYWGEQLTEITLSGTTGSSGIEGINALYEIYRAEQLAFDTQGLLMDSQNNTSISDNLTGLASGLLGGFGVGGEIAAGILGLNSTSNPLATKNLPTMAQYAFGVEMYYSGVVYRGFFESMTVTEAADNFSFQYDIKFTVTQKRGYRRNYLPFHRNPQGPSDTNSPHTYNGIVDNDKIEPLE